MKADVRWARVRMKASMQGETLGPIQLRGLGKGDTVIVDAPVLLFSQALLDIDGFVVVRFLRELEAKEKKLYGVYGPFLDVGLIRCHLIAPITEATEKNFLVYEWSIEEWLKTSPQKTIR